jgi:hypothetical protein
VSINKLDFLKKEKKATRQADQKTTCKGLVKLRRAKMPRRIEGVIGSFLETESPNSLLVPRFTVAMK